MTADRLRGATRRLIGAPDVNKVPDVEIDQFLIPAIQWFAGQMKALIVTDNTIGLVAEQREYILPADLLYVLWVEVNSNLLEPSTTWSLNAGSNNVGPTTGTSGQTWMTIASGTPTRFAVEGRKLILSPPASAAFVAATPVMRWRYISLGPTFSPQSTGLSPQGVPGLNDLDLLVIRYSAAAAWISAHLIGQTGDQIAALQAQAAAHEAQVAKLLPECKRRWMDSIEPSTKTMRVAVDRQGAAR